MPIVTPRLPLRNVPLLDLAVENEAVAEDIFAALQEVARSQRFILGEVNTLFEREIAAYLDVPFALGCANGSDAIVLALLACGVGPGDKVIVPAFTFFATASAVSRVGAVPVFADVDGLSFQMDAAAVERAAQGHAGIKAVIPVHLFGGSADLDPVLALARSHGWHVIEDGAQSIGARYKDRSCLSIGHIGTLSFFPTKNLGAWGDAGMVVTSDEDLARRLAALRVHGSTQRYRHDWIGMNSRLDSLQAAVLRAKLPRLDGWTRQRQANAARFEDLLGGKDLPLQLPRPFPWQTRHVWNQYVIRPERRDEVRAALAAAGVGTEIYYPIPLHLQPCYEFLGYRAGDLPVSERLCGQVLALPIHFSIGEADIEYICERLIGILQGF